MLLYAQPLSRILRLGAADLSRDDTGQTWLRLGDPPSPVPAPFGALLHQLAATRHVICLTTRSASYRARPRGRQASCQEQPDDIRCRR